MTPIQMVDAGIQALRLAEGGQLGYEAAAHTAMAWAALADATVRVNAGEHEHTWRDSSYGNEIVEHCTGCPAERRRKL
jgi:hypothetical protein